MRKTFTTTLMALLLCVCMVFGLTACTSQEDIDNAVNSATAPLNGQITALEADIADKTAKISTLEGEKTALTTEKGELEADVTALEAEKATLEADKAELEADLATLEAEKKALSDENAALEASITAKNTEIATLNSSVASLEAEKTTLNGRVTELEGTITEKNATIADLEADVETLSSAKADLEAQITTLNGTIAEKNDEIATLNSSISALNTEKANLTARVSALEASITAKDTQIAELNSSIATLTDKVAELEGKNELLEGKNEQLKGENEQLEAEKEALKNCLAGKHVMHTDGEITYAWSKDYATCTATGVCVYCDGATTEVANGVTDDNKITATFENSALEAQVVHTVTTYDELNTLLESGEAVTIRLGATLNNIQSLYCQFGTTAVLDMNGNDITFDAVCDLFVHKASLTLKGEGTITTSGVVAIECSGSLSIEDNVTVNSDWYAIYIQGASADEAATIIISGGTINAQGEGKNFAFGNDYASLTITGGTFSCDPTVYVDTEKYEVTDNDDGAYTVSCNHKDSAHTATFDLGDDTHGFICTVCGGIAKESHSLITIDKGNGTHSNNCTVCDSKSTEKHSYGDNDECACGAKIPVVMTADELLEAVEKGGYIKLGDSFTINTFVNIFNNVTLDLNGKTLTATGNGFWVNEGATLNVSNGTILSNSTIINNGGTVSVEGCTLTGEANAFINFSGTLSLKDCTVNGCAIAEGGTVTLYENITFGHGTAHEDYTGIHCVEGNVICHFDPDGHIRVGSVTDNGDGTWTVTKAE